MNCLIRRPKINEMITGTSKFGRISITGETETCFGHSCFCFFRPFKQTLQFLQQICLKNSPSNICCWDSNPQPSDHEPPHITPRPGLPSASKL